MMGTIKVYGYDVQIIERNGKQNIKIVAKIGKSRITKEIMTKIYKYLIYEGFITNPLYTY